MCRKHDPEGKLLDLQNFQDLLTKKSKFGKILVNLGKNCDHASWFKWRTYQRHVEEILRWLYL